jgi:hypothetical protein
VSPVVGMFVEFGGSDLLDDSDSENDIIMNIGLI